MSDPAGFRWTGFSFPLGTCLLLSLVLSLVLSVMRLLQG
jgi:hypothetical protein